MEHLLTVIIQTSPLPLHPSTSLIEALFRSFDRVSGLKDCNIIILADGYDRDAMEESKLDGDLGCDNRHIKRCHNDKFIDIDCTKKKCNNYKHGRTLSSESIRNYRLYLSQVREMIRNQTPPFCSTNNGSILLLELNERFGSANALEAVFSWFGSPTSDNNSQDFSGLYTITSSSAHSSKPKSTPYVMIAQHDNFFVRDVGYLSPLIQYMQRIESTSWLHCLHFPSTATLNYIQKIKRRYQLDLANFCHERNDNATSLIRGVFIPLVFWYGRTHIARWEYYTKQILVKHPLRKGDHLEEIWGTKQLRHLMELKTLDNMTEFDESFRRVHAMYGNYVFFEASKENGILDDNQHEVLYHLSGRKVRAGTLCQSNIAHLSSSMAKPMDRNCLQKRSPFHPHGGSFTIARRATAVVPGLEVIDATSSIGNTSSTRSENNTQLLHGRFKQRCFHCGEKGHSFKFCAAFAEDETYEKPELEILDLT
ncbi:hypothetical protein ACHAW6_011385 [Cyclotella cf. meneghiniana]